MDRRAWLSSVGTLSTWSVASAAAAPFSSFAQSAAPATATSGAAAGTGASPQAAPRPPQWPKRPAPPIGTVMTLPPTRLVDGTVLPPEYWRGKVLIVELWATWCPFCSAQNPYVDALHRNHASRGLEVLGLSIDRRIENVVAYMKNRGFAFHAAMFDDNWYQALGKPSGTPIIWVIDRQSVLRQVEIGELFPEDVAALARWI